MLADNYGNLVHRATVLAKKDAGGAPIIDIDIDT